ncbi:MAG TPA: hypothetical protein VH008_23800, partial [Pseudonocardia sp.]|nr:hypothetical protein [Pseudonocardia sp.]
RLVAGQTAEVAVATQSVDNVLTVPNAAVLRDGGQSFVNIPGPDGKPIRTPFQPGVVGDSSTQVVSGCAKARKSSCRRSTRRRRRRQASSAGTDRSGIPV